MAYGMRGDWLPPWRRLPMNLQIVEWYDELLLLTASPVVRLNRAMAVAEADGP